MDPHTLDRFRELITVEHGLILVTGPTGSGKSTTLYSALKQLNSKEKNILTLEDPIEYQLDGISQTQVSEKKGMTFASGLRSVLRQDPDVIMVGEIRDLETATMAIQSSLTGHLVFSTLHTNDAASAVTRLLDLGIEPYLVASSLVGVLAQRLVRRVCPDCAAPYRPTASELEWLGVDRRRRRPHAPRAGLPRLPPHRLPRPARHVRAAGARRRHPPTDPGPRDRLGDQGRRPARRHAHASATTASKRSSPARPPSPRSSASPSTRTWPTRNPRGGRRRRTAGLIHAGG